MKSEIGRVLLGDNPFIGVNHLAQERIRERDVQLDSSRIAGVIDSAFKSGAEGLVCSAHPIMTEALNYMREEGYPGVFDVYLILPDVQTYVRLASERGMIGLLNETLGSLSLMGKAKAMARGSLSALASDPTRMMKTYLDAEVSLFSKSLPKHVTVRSVFLHELLTELIVSFEMNDLAEEYIDFVKNSLNIMPGFVTRNFARFVDFSRRARFPLSDVVVMTPFNKVGFQMNPSRESCEMALDDALGLNVIAMSVLASGYLRLREAVEYIRGLRGLTSCVVGVSNEAHAIETFSYLRTVFT